MSEKVDTASYPADMPPMPEWLIEACKQVAGGWPMGYAAAGWVAGWRAGADSPPVPRDIRLGYLDALKIAGQHGQTDGAHHKQWVIDQMIRALTGPEYDLWRHAVPDWDEGIAP